MKKSALKLAIASTVFAAGSAMAADTGTIDVQLNIGDFANLILNQTSILMTATAADVTGLNTVTGTANGCAYSSDGTYSFSVTSTSTGSAATGAESDPAVTVTSNLVGVGGITIPYDFTVTAGPNQNAICSLAPNFTVDTAVTFAGSEAPGAYNDVLTVLITL